jgi:hypothetical protein
MKTIKIFFICFALALLNSCAPTSDDYIEISKSDYKNQLHGFWLGQCIANWTGLITEMDKIGFDTPNTSSEFYTRDNWGAQDLPNLWGSNNYSQTIDFIYAEGDSLWGADDDTDIEYIYQELLLENKTPKLSGEQIKNGWLKHIKAEEENYLWVSNQTAFDLMGEGVVPPMTSDPELNSNFNMIDAQLTTEIFGFYAPGYPEIAVDLAQLPIRTTAREEAAEISEFYVRLYALGAVPSDQSPKERIFGMAEEARAKMDVAGYPAKMYDFVKSNYLEGKSWEETRDELHLKYQINQEDNYKMATTDTICQGCFAAGINFGAGMISYFYGEGDFKETVKIGALCGWDSDNPTATWGGLLGFMYGAEQLSADFGVDFSNQFNIHRTRQGFKNNGIDTFENMADKGIQIIEMVNTNFKLYEERDQKWLLPKEK